MALKLSSQDQEFRNSLLFHGDAKTIDLERVLLNLFMLIKYNGVPPQARVGRKSVTPQTLLKKLIEREAEGIVEGFVEKKEKVYWWIMTNLVDLVNRGNPDKEALASLKAIHLNSYKFCNPKHVRDYKISDQVFAMFQESPYDIIKDLRNFLSYGWDTFSESIETKEMDIDTLGILRIVEKVKDDRAGDNTFRTERCLCKGQARVFCEDVRRLLIYGQVIPRHVLLEYLRTIIGLHVGLYVFRLFKMLSDWVAKGGRNPICKECSVDESSSTPFKDCPYVNEFVVDCGDNPESEIARLAESDATYYFARIHDYIRATFSINLALQFSVRNDYRKLEDIDIALQAIKDRGVRWDERFQLRTEDLLGSINEEQRQIFQPIIDMKLPPFETFVEMVTLARTSFHVKYHRELIDSLFQKNKDTGLLWAGKSRKYKRRFWLSSRLLETLVQLAVLKTRSNDSNTNIFYSDPILIESFLQLIQNRYGIIVNGIDHPRFRLSDISIHKAFKENVLCIKTRLREIGFFNILSDASIMQRIHPRYPINREEGKENV